MSFLKSFFSIGTKEKDNFIKNLCNVSNDKLIKLDKLYGKILEENNNFLNLEGSKENKINTIFSYFKDIQETLRFTARSFKVGEDSTNNKQLGDLTLADFQAYVRHKQLDKMDYNQILSSDLVLFSNNLKDVFESNLDASWDKKYTEAKNRFVKQNQENIVKFSTTTEKAFEKNLIIPEWTLLKRLGLFDDKYETDINEWSYTNHKSISNLTDGALSVMKTDTKKLILTKINDSKIYFDKLYILDIINDFEVKTDLNDAEGMTETHIYKYNPYNVLHFKDDYIYKFENHFYTSSLLLLIKDLSKKYLTLNNKLRLNKASYDKMIECSKYYFPTEIEEYTNLFNLFLTDSSSLKLDF